MDSSSLIKLHHADFSEKVKEVMLKNLKVFDGESPEHDFENSPDIDHESS